MMNDELTEMYCNWLADQNLSEAWAFEAEQEVLKELAEQPASPDWSTWCQALCS
jgi:hypothetical protein